MKPLNLDNKPCSPISSNCVVWQGPDIPCIELCTGDTVSDVVFQMATELCTILDTLKVSNYDLTCFNLQACGPTDFQALIQFLITKICELEGVSPVVKDESDCPDCVVSVAECFVIGTQTTMQLVDYVQLIGQKICSLINDIDVINGQITELWSAVIELQNITPGTAPRITAASTCDLGLTINAGQQYPIQIILEAFFDTVWCDFYAVTGTVAELSNAIDRQCIDNVDETLSFPGQDYDTAYGLWVPAPSTIADTILNLWIAVCDIYSFLEANSASWTITVADTNTIDLELSVGNELTAKIQDTGWVPLEGFDFYSSAMLLPGFRPECRRFGNVIHFRGLVYVPLDGGGGGTATELKNPDTYDTLTSATSPALNGAGSGVSLSGDTLSFNLGVTCIPATVHAGVLDAEYRMGYPTVMVRPIVVDAGIFATTALSSVVRFGIRETGVLFLETVQSIERSNLGLSSTTLGSSALRFITSNVRTGETVPDYTSNDSDLHSFPVPTLFDDTLGYSIGDVVIYGGQLYVAIVNTLPPGPNGAPASTPGIWNLYEYPVQTKVYDTALYPLDCDAGTPVHLGGFYTSIDGLMAYVDCTAAKATKDCYTP